jgi:pimeloyl-ACP methyl ester carboxylesterase
VTVYWATETANSAARSYYERAHDTRRLSPDDRIRVPTGVGLTTEPIEHAPREWAERRYTDLRRWTEFTKGGHFFAAEEPEVLAGEIEFFRELR